MLLDALPDGHGHRRPRRDELRALLRARQPGDPERRRPHDAYVRTGSPERYVVSAATRAPPLPSAMLDVYFPPSSRRESSPGRGPVPDKSWARDELLAQLDALATSRLRDCFARDGHSTPSSSPTREHLHGNLGKTTQRGARDPSALRARRYAHVSAGRGSARGSRGDRSTRSRSWSTVMKASVRWPALTGVADRSLTSPSLRSREQSPESAP